MHLSLAFAALAAGLWRAACNMETHLNTTRHLLRTACAATCAALLLLLLSDVRGAAWRAAAGLGAQCVYWRLPGASPGTAAAARRRRLRA
jgi:hypothetical protein